MTAKCVETDDFEGEVSVFVSLYPNGAYEVECIEDLLTKRLVDEKELTPFELDQMHLNADDLAQEYSSHFSEKEIEIFKKETITRPEAWEGNNAFN